MRIAGGYASPLPSSSQFGLTPPEKAIEVSESQLRQELNLIGAYVKLACAHAQLGHQLEAKQFVDALIKLVPRYRLRALRKNPMFVDPDAVKKVVDSMKLAGLPE